MPKDYDIKEVANIVEAVLFSAGKYVSLEELSKLTGLEESILLEGIKLVKEKYEKMQGPIFLSDHNTFFKLNVKEKYLPYVRNLTPALELPKPILQTLAVIAWRSPVLQSEVVKIRGTNAYDHIKELVDLGLIEKEKSGNSFLLKITNKFKEYFEVVDENKLKSTLNKVEVPEIVVQENVKEEKDVLEEKRKISKVLEEEKKEVEKELKKSKEFLEKIEDKLEEIDKKIEDL